MFIICDELRSQVVDEIYSKLVVDARNQQLTSSVLMVSDNPSPELYFSWMKHTFDSNNSICIIVDSWLKDNYKNDLERYQIRHLERWLLSRNAIVITETPQKLIEKTSLTIVDLTRNSISIDQLQYLSSLNKGPGAGHWAPGESILLVCERSNHWGDMDFVAPYTTFNRSDCSAWFTEQLDHANIFENQLYWINATRADNSFEDASFIDELNPRKIFALGDVAWQWAVINDIKVERVVDPQYHMQYQSNSPYLLIDKILNCLL